MLLERFVTPGLAVYSYLLADESIGDCVIIDPVRDIEQYTAYIQANNLRLIGIIETHVHADFVSGARDLKAFFQDQPKIYCSSMGGEKFLAAYAGVTVKDGQVIQVGRAHLKAIHTPGHSPEHLIWVCYDETRSSETPWFAFTGDLILVGSVGRPDLVSKESVRSSAKDLYNSLFEKIKHLPDHLEIHPAHGAGTLCGKAASGVPESTLGYERLFNPGFKQKPMDEWIENLLKGMPAAPQGYSRIKQTNLAGPAPRSKALPTPKEVKAAEARKAFVIDIRPPAYFAKGHLKGSINIPYGPSFCNMSEMFVPGNATIVFAVSNLELLGQLYKDYWNMGFDDIAGYYLLDASANEPLNSVAVKDLAADSNWTVLDVRTMPEWHSGHIKGALHIELAQVAARLDEIPKNTPVAVICHSGNRSAIAAAYLQKNGYSQAASVAGGMDAWIKSGLSTER